MSGLWLASYVALWLLLVLIAIGLLSALYHLGVIYNRLESNTLRFPPPTKISPGDIVPEVTLIAQDGSPSSIAQFSGEKTAFVVVSPDCAPCLEFLEGVKSDNGMVDRSVYRIVIMSIGDLASTMELARKADVSSEIPLLIDTERMLEEVWGVSTTPIMLTTDEHLALERQHVVVHDQMLTLERAKRKEGRPHG